MPDIEYLLRKLSFVADLTEKQRQVLNALFDGPRHVSAGTVLVSEGEPNYTGFVICEGWAARERLLNDGDRQVVNFMVPGDLSEPGAFVTNAADHTITTLTDSVIRCFPHHRWFHTLRQDPVLTLVVWWLAAHEEAVLKEHIVALGRRRARPRLLYMMWELCRRLEMVGLCRDHRFALPAGNADLADALGLSPRHLSRVLAEVRHEGIIDVGDGYCVIRDPDRLLSACDCRDVYLQITSIASAVRDTLSQDPAPV
ncbi:Crp/Fnr family transcriptional regulator [Caenispirillum salinarum]|uniref:Crp/Fnr family transcriptional regulator n=1 Tax=Caenispirillum salinarum TaxID=859058 RepID=UPI00384FEBEE